MSVRDVLLEQPAGDMPAGRAGLTRRRPARWPGRGGASGRAAQGGGRPRPAAAAAIITAAPAEEACVCDMTDAVGLSQPTVSHHLKVLVEAGILTRERRGSWAWFALVPGRLTEIAGVFG